MELRLFVLGFSVLLLLGTVCRPNNPTANDERRGGFGGIPLSLFSSVGVVDSSSSDTRVGIELVLQSFLERYFPADNTLVIFLRCSIEKNFSHDTLIKTFQCLSQGFFVRLLPYFFLAIFTSLTCYWRWGVFYGEKFLSLRYNRHKIL